MDLFTSKHERNLWLWAIAAVVIIYSTLGLAGRLTSVLADRGRLDDVYVFCFTVIVGVIIASGIWQRTRRFELWAAAGIVAILAMVVVRMGIAPAERTHLFEYGLVAVLIYLALLERKRNGRNIPVPAILAIGATILIGVIDECIQGILPNRVSDFRDLGFNVVGSILAVATCWAVAKAKSYVSSVQARRSSPP